MKIILPESKEKKKKKDIIQLLVPAINLHLKYNHRKIDQKKSNKFGKFSKQGKKT